MDLLATNEIQQTVASSDADVSHAIYQATDIPVAEEVEISSEQNRAVSQTRVVPITARIRMHGRRKEIVEHSVWIEIKNRATGGFIDRLYHRQERNDSEDWEDEPDEIVEKRRIGRAVIRKPRRHTPVTRSRIYLRTHTSNRSSIARTLRRLRLRKELAREFLKTYYEDSEFGYL